MTRPLYVEHGVIVPARVAALYSRLLAAPRVAAVLDRIADPEEFATRAALRTAAKAYEQAGTARRSGETGGGADRAPWPHEIDTGEAARLLGVTRRRVQQLAAGGLGRRDAAGRWRLDAAAVAVLAERGRGSHETGGSAGRGRGVVRGVAGAGPVG